MKQIISMIGLCSLTLVTYGAEIKPVTNKYYKEAASVFAFGSGASLAFTIGTAISNPLLAGIGSGITLVNSIGAACMYNEASKVTEKEDGTSKKNTLSKIFSNGPLSSVVGFSFAAFFIWILGINKTKN